MKTLLIKTLTFFITGLYFFINTVNAQNIFPSTGRTGIYTTSPITSLQVKGGARIGTTANYVNIDSATGKLTFGGTGVYQVAGNKYAFQYTGNPNYGLFFNSSSVQYEFRNGSAIPVFSINANTGNSVFNGTVKVGAYTLPATDGTNGQVLKTNGSGGLTWSNDNGTSYTAGTGISISGTTITNTAPDKTVVLTGGGATTISGTYPNFTISSTDNNTTYTAGTGLSLSGTTFTNTAPDQTVVLTAGTGISVTGTYPGFTISNTGVGGWALTGNAGTNPSVNFIGTTDANPLVFRVNNVRAGFIDYDNTKGNTSFGYQNLISNTGAYNTAFGYNSLYSNTTGFDNTANGNSALYYNTTGYYNTANGAFALYYNTTGYLNTANGTDALFNNTTGYSNTANGPFALVYNTTGYENTANGDDALYSNTTGDDNTANGYTALFHNTTGTGNTANGPFALYYNTTGFSNTANGAYALYSNTTGDGNTANGTDALYSDTTGFSNTANGAGALYANTTGYSNTANGHEALYANTTGYSNTANGLDALFYNTTGFDNTANGYDALYANTTGYYNTANGGDALYSNTTGIENTANGYGALYSNTTGYFNTATGNDALNDNTAGGENTANGDGALLFNTTGSGNTAYGNDALLSNTTGSDNTAIGDLTDVNNSNYYNSTALGEEALITASNQVRIGDDNVTSIGGYTGWTNISDGRAKKNIKANVPGLAFINLLKPITYNLDLDAADKIIQRPAIKDKDGKTIQPSQQQIASRQLKQQVVCTGFIAQDVEASAKKIGYDFDGVDAAKNDKDLYGLRYSEFVVPLVKGEQELSKQNDSLKSIVSSLQNQINELKAMMVSGNQSAMSGQQLTVVSSASLEQNIPNPFTNNTTIGYSLPQKITAAQIIITDKSGKTLKAVTISGSGKGSLTVNASTLSSGAYQYSLIVDGRLIDTKQMVLAK